MEKSNEGSGNRGNFDVEGLMFFNSLSIVLYTLYVFMVSLRPFTDGLYSTGSVLLDQMLSLPELRHRRSYL